MTNEERIKADAEAAAKIVEQRLKSRNVEYGRMVSQVHGYTSGYIAGATAEHDRAQVLVDALEWIKRYGPCDELTVKFIDKQLEQWKGKEPQQLEPKPDLGTCVECKIRPATTDYNGHQHYVCKLCDDSLNREFDEEYR